MVITRNEALSRLHEWVKSPSLRRHSYAVEIVMRAAAHHYGGSTENSEQWALTGLLHDADYEIAPNEHPRLIVDWLRRQNEKEMAYAISAHGVTWGVPYVTPLDRSLVACDELTGFVVACSLMRPDGVLSLTPTSVMKKLQNLKFAAGVDRQEVYRGVEILEANLESHILFVISALKEHAEEISLGGKAGPNAERSTA